MLKATIWVLKRCCAHGLTFIFNLEMSLIRGRDGIVETKQWLFSGEDEPIWTHKI